MTVNTRVVGLALMISGVLVLTSSSYAGTVVDQSGPNSGAGGIAGDGGNTYGVGWSQTQAYENVSVSATLLYGGSYFGSTSGDFEAFLSTSYGVGATAFATQTISVPTTVTSPTTYLLFSGLTLGPGDYYLTVAATDTSSNPAWETSSGTIVLGSGVTYLGNAQSIGADLSAPYQSFGGFGGATPLEFTVTGDPTPEPGTWGFVFAGLALACLKRRRPGSPARQSSPSA